MYRPSLFVLSFCFAATALSTGVAISDDAIVGDDAIALQRKTLSENTKGLGFGPQSPRDLTVMEGMNRRAFEAAPPYAQMNLCNIHFHENAEHKGGEFTTYAGNGDGKGAGTGYRYDGELTEAETAPIDRKVGEGQYGDLAPGDTIELHYVYTTAQVEPGPTLGACLSEAVANPQLRVEAQVFAIVNDAEAGDLVDLTNIEQVDGFFQAVNKPYDTGEPISYGGSTTGPSFNEQGSPLKVTWSVRPEVLKVSIDSVERWLADNPFDEKAAHGVRNLVDDPELMSEIKG